MKYLLTFILLFSLQAKAESIEATFGGLTYHLINHDEVSELFANKIGDSGKLIYTGLLGFGLSSDHYTYRMFVGENSIGEFMFGSTVSYTWKLSVFRLGPIVGFYNQDDSKFIAKGIKPFSFGFGIVPIIGADLSMKLLTFDENKYVKLNTIITPVVINQTISLGMEL